MSATYDGKLGWSQSSKRLEPCCMTMHEWIICGRVYPPSKGGIAIRIDERRGTELRFCPFCGARAEAVQ